MFGPPGMTSTSNQLVSKVQIHVSCKDLLDKDILSKSDPFAVFYTNVKNPSKQEQWKEIGRTETMQNCLSPSFVKFFEIDYYFEEFQLLKFEIYDSDSSSQSLSDHEFLGMIQFSLGSLVGENRGNITKSLVRKDGQPLLKSTINIKAEEMNNCNSEVSMCFRGIKLDKKDFFGKSDPYLIFYRQAIEQDGCYTPVHKTEVIKNTLNPTWQKINLSLRTLCNGDQFRPIKIECYDWDSDGSHDLIGVTELTINDMVSKKQLTLDLINSKKKAKKKGYKNSGTIELTQFDLIEVPSFLDYIMGGTELCFHVAVDFTASNGVPSDPSSLHYHNLQQPNEYAQALWSVGQICEDYDSDKLIPAYGFGAKINGQVYHNFNLNLTADSTCYGIRGVLDAYHQAIHRVELYGPTNFSPILNAVAQQVKNDLNNKYHILLILTDGIISDRDSTIRAVIEASKLALSIIIVGVGGADFSAMNVLDADDELLKFGAYIAERDIVQFVPFRKFSGNLAGDSLSREVLYELPGQLVGYMMKHGIKPKHQISSGGSAPPYQDNNATAYTGQGLPPYFQAQNQPNDINTPPYPVSQ